MPVVFIHGVANRPGPAYDKGVAQRETFFRETVCKTLLGNSKATILQPIWGDLVPPFPASNPIIPTVDPQGVAPFGPEAFGAAGLRPGTNELVGVTLEGKIPPQEERVVTIAKRSFTEAIDLLWHEAAQLPAVRGHEDREADLLAYGVVASAYAAENPQPDWVAESADDTEFLEKLSKELEKWRKAPAPKPPAVEAFGFDLFGTVKGWLTGAVQTVQKTVIDIPTNALLRAIRPGLTEGLVHFFGDVFFYQTFRGTKENPGSIIKAVLDPLRQARKEADEKDEKLIVVGHSMGGNILYDIFTHYAEDLEVDALITVGCQASVFKQLRLFQNQASGTFGAGAKAPKPASVKHWLNVFDPQDILSFAFEPEFTGVTDFFFESPGGLLGAHGEYFERIRFYERIVARLS